VLYLDHKGISARSKFRVPYLNGKYLVGILLFLAILGLLTYGQSVILEWRMLSFAEIMEHKLLTIIFWITWCTFSILSYQYNFSALPVAGILTNLYLMTELGASNWLIFVIWLAIGLVIYFSYGYRQSKLAQK
jgi:APA family basic amino acid/polyamine antiporter